MSSSEARKNMARAGTMQVTSKEGMSYLQKHLPAHYGHLAQLKVHFAEENETKLARKRSAAAKNKTPAKKPRLAKSRTMAATAKEGAMLLGNEVLGDTRQMTKKKATVGKAKTARATVAKKQTKTKKATKAVANAKNAKSNKSKATKKGKKPSLKKANTMVNTAKEGKAFIGKGGATLSSKRRCQKS